MKSQLIIFFTSILFISCFQNHEVEGLWKPRVINQFESIFEEQLQIANGEYEISFISPDTTIIINSSYHQVTNKDSIYYQTCIEYIENQTSKECFCFKKGKEDVLLLWNCKNNEVIMTYDRVFK
jgi:hypothetical protein